MLIFSCRKEGGGDFRKQLFSSCEVSHAILRREGEREKGTAEILISLSFISFFFLSRESEGETAAAENEAAAAAANGMREK